MKRVAVLSGTSTHFTPLGRIVSRSDAELPERFLRGATAMPRMRLRSWSRRHGPMVLGVCRRMLRASHDVEDAFQATFLVLARRAASIVRRERVASWLYGVAVRTAQVARRRAARQRAAERRLMDKTFRGQVGARGGRGPAPDPGRGVESLAAPIPGRSGGHASSSVQSRARGCAGPWYPRGDAVSPPGRADGNGFR